MSEENDLWELVRKKVYNEEPEENIGNTEKTKEDNAVNLQTYLDPNRLKKLDRNLIKEGKYIMSLLYSFVNK